ncbi:MAG: modification methylase, HemK family [Candidatus Saccharibacteria bacterium]|nr:modification methylase, HemK family [Candidatus Saccharibacteria bacterium]
MNVEEYLKNAINALAYKEVPTARLDVLVLLEDVLSKDRGWLLAHLDLPLDEPTIKKLNELIKRRAGHEPLAYIRGHSEFYGREFLVTADTLQPRAETEIMIDLLKSLKIKNPIIADIGTGSGCLAITTALELPDSEVYATEINAAALAVARKNAKKLKAGVTFYKGNLLEPVLSADVQPTVLLANLPYVPDDYEINQAAGHEPKIALFGGKDGLDLYRELFALIDDSAKIATKLQFLLTESLPFQHAELAKIAKKHGFKQNVEQDFIQVFERII